MSNLLNEFFNSNPEANKYLTSEQIEDLKKDFQEWHDKKSLSFVEVTEPVMKYISKYWNPMTRVIIDCNMAELLEGQLTHNNNSFIKD